MMIHELSPILAVHDVEQALAFYTEKLGFELVAQMGDPTEYGIIQRDNFSVHFKRLDQPLVANGAFEGNLNAGKGGIYVLVSDVDAVARELEDRGAAEKIEPENKDYGMRDFWIADPFGYAVCFGAKLG